MKKFLSMNLWNFWAKLKFTRREKYYIAVGVVAVGIILLLECVILPLADMRKSMKKSVWTQEKVLQDIYLLSSEYRKLRENSINVQQVLSKRPKDFTLFSFLEKQASRTSIKENIKYMKPSTAVRADNFEESSVEMSLDDITLLQLVEYLYLVESSENLVSIKRISIKKSKNSPEYLTVLMHLITYK